MSFQGLGKKFITPTLGGQFLSSLVLVLNLRERSLWEKYLMWKIPYHLVMESLQSEGTKVFQQKHQVEPDPPKLRDFSGP